MNDAILEINFALLTIIALSIIVFGICVSVLFYQLKMKRINYKYESTIKNINIEKDNKNIQYLNNEAIELIKRYLIEYEKIDINTNVSIFNRKYLNWVTDILNSNEVQEVKDFNECSRILEILNILIKTSPYTWSKKYKREMEEIYVR